MEIILFEFGLILVLSALLGMLAKRFNQPTILGYIIAGLVISFWFEGGSTGDMLEVFSQLGIAFLLFLLGVELNIKEVKEVGPAALATGIGQVLVTFTLGFGISRLAFGFEVIEAAYIGVALTFSSTIVIVKLLGEKGDLNSLYGRISVGLLIVQDLIAVLALIALNSLVGTSGGGGVIEQIGVIAFTGLLLVVFALIVGRGLEILLTHVGKSSELVLLSVLSWALMFSVLTQTVGFSLEVGAFLAGIVLSTSALSVEITAKIKPLRDFFIIIFFIHLGMGLSLDGITTNIVPILILALFVLVGNPIILLTVMGVMGYHRRVSFLVGLTVSQISEFSLIIVATGVNLGQISSETTSIVTGVAIITLVVSSYLISHGDLLYEILEDVLKVFQRQSLKHYAEAIELKGQKVLVVGAHRMGSRVVKALVEAKIDVVVIDYDPVSIANMKELGVPAIYGDLSDAELLGMLDQDEVKVIVSTVPSYEDTLLLVAKISEFAHRPKLILRANSDKEAGELQKLGADIVLVPERVAGDKIVQLLKDDGLMEKVSKKRKRSKSE